MHGYYQFVTVYLQCKLLVKVSVNAHSLIDFKLVYFIPLQLHEVQGLWF